MSARLRLSRILAFLACLLAVRAAEQHPGPPQRLAASRPNIVFIMSDDQGYGELSCHWDQFYLPRDPKLVSQMDPILKFVRPRSR
jgi:hypothetical protein